MNNFMLASKISSNLIITDNITKGFKYGIQILEQLVNKMPFAINYDLTWNCNLRCKHCYFFSSASELEHGNLDKRKRFNG